MGKSVFLQILNGYLVTFAICAMITFARYLKRKWSLGYEELKPAIVMAALCLGEIALRGPIFYTRTLINADTPHSEPYFAYVTGGLLVSWAYLCMIKVFSLRGESKSWIISFTIGTIVVGLSLLYSYGGEYEVDLVLGLRTFFGYR